MGKQAVKRIILLLLIIIVCVVVGFILHERRSFTVNEIDTQNTEKSFTVNEIDTQNTEVSSEISEIQVSDEEMEGILVVREENEKLMSVNKLQVADAIGEIAISIYPETKVLPSFIVAYAMFKSVWGIADVTEVNNYFYLPYTKGCGTKYKIFSDRIDGDLVLDEESYIGDTYAYRAYATVEEGIMDYENYLLSTYPELEGETDYDEICYLVDEENADAIIMMIEQYQFDVRYDVPAINLE